MYDIVRIQLCMFVSMYTIVYQAIVYWSKGTETEQSV